MQEVQKELWRREYLGKKKDGEGILFAAQPDAIQWAVSGRARQRELLCRHFLLFKLKPMPKRNPSPVSGEG